MDLPENNAERKSGFSKLTLDNVKTVHEIIFERLKKQEKLLNLTLIQFSSQEAKSNFFEELKNASSKAEDGLTEHTKNSSLAAKFASFSDHQNKNLTELRVQKAKGDEQNVGLEPRAMGL